MKRKDLLSEIQALGLDPSDTVSVRYSEGQWYVQPVGKAERTFVPKKPVNFDFWGEDTVELHVNAGEVRRTTREWIEND